MESIGYIFSSLPNLSYLNLDGKRAATANVLLALLTDLPRLRSLVGLGIDSVNYRSVARLASLVAETLENISIVEVASMAEVVARIAHHHPTVTLPYLLRLNVVPFYEGIDFSHDHLAEGWAAPQVRIFSFGMEANQFMGEGEGHIVVKAFGSCREITLAMGYLCNGQNLRSLLTLAAQLETVAFHLSPDPLWLARVNPADQTTSSSVRSCILVQQSSEGLDATMSGAISSYLSSFFGGSVFPSLERVYYLTQEPNDLIWPL